MKARNSTVVESFKDCSHLLEDAEALRATAQRDGFLYFRGLLDRAAVESTMQAACSLLARLGYAAAEPDDEGCIVARRHPNDEFFGSGIDADAYRELQRLEEFHFLARSPQLMSLMRRLIGAEVLLHPNFIIRSIFPRGFATPPHQDLAHTRGSTNAWTCWMPLTPCPMRMGGIAVLPGSHHALLPTKAQANGGRETLLPPGEHGWVAGDLHPGDAVIFSGKTVHRALVNDTGNIRLSIDCRFQPRDDAIRAVSLAPHGDLQGWDEIYSGWRDQSACYYWKTGDLNVIDPAAG